MFALASVSFDEITKEAELTGASHNKGRKFESLAIKSRTSSGDLNHQSESEKSKILAKKPIVKSEPESKAEYNFPEKSAQTVLSRASTELLNEKLDRLVKVESYHDIRDAYCAVHLELNNRHAICSDDIKAPRFRSRRKVKFRASKGGYLESEKLLSNDAQVIDLHWLYSHGRTDANDVKGKGIFSGEAFNFEVASEYVRARGKAEDKAEWLGLDTDEQWALAVIQSSGVREDWKRLSAIIEPTSRRLKQKAKRVSSIRGNEEEWVQVYIAVEIEKSINCTDEVMPSHLLQWFQLMTGRKISRQNMKNKLNAVIKHIG